jgi:hypothetical protein
MPHLESLSLSSHRQTDTRPEEPHSLKLDQLSSLTTLKLHNMTITDGILLPPSIESLIFNNVRPQLLFPPGAWHPNLRHIELTKCYGTRDILETLLAKPDPSSDELDMECPVEVFTQLESLKIGGLEFGVRLVMDALFQPDIRSIFRISRLTDIKSLAIDSHIFDDDTMEVIKGA